MQAKYYLVEGPWPGRLAILPRPRGGEWLADEVRAWRAAGIDTVVSLLTPDEAEVLDIQAEEAHCASERIDFVGFPIEDRDVPVSIGATLELAKQLATQLQAGQTVAVQCRIGVGRSALIAACLLASAGVDADDAFRRITAARGLAVPDTPEQRRWVERFAEKSRTLHPTTV